MSNEANAAHAGAKVARWLQAPASGAALMPLLQVADQHIARLEARVAELEALLDKSRLPHSPDCLTTYNRAYPCSCAARWHNARIDAALEETEHGE